jgi:predicted ester cyclase
MSEIERNKQVVLGQHRDVWSCSDPDAVDRYYAPEAVCHLAGRDFTGSAEIKSIIVRRRTAFPDWLEDVESILAEGDLVASRVTSTATHTGPFLGIEATGRRISTSEMFLFQLRDGLIVECWAELDMLGLMNQLRTTSAQT